MIQLFAKEKKASASDQRAHAKFFICIYQCHLKAVFWLCLPGFTCLVQQCRPVWRRPCCLLHLVQALGQAAHSGPDCASVATSTNNSRCYTTKSILSFKWQTVGMASVLALSLVFMSCFSFNLVHGGLVVLNVHKVKVNQEQSISSILIFTGKGKPTQNKLLLTRIENIHFWELNGKETGALYFLTW